jgi:ribosomal-protein-alanine N-acetyltransferase
MNSSLPGAQNSVFVTARMRARPLVRTDVGAIYRQFADPEMCRFTGEPACTLQEAAGIVTHYQQRTLRFQRFALISHRDEQFVGTCGHHFFDQDASQVEIGYDIWRTHWHQGYAREMLPALLTYCVQTLQVRTIYACIHHENVASQAVVRRAGFVLSAPLRAGISANEACWALAVHSTSTSGKVI